MKKRRMESFCYVVIFTFAALTLFNPLVVAGDYWQAFSFQEGQYFTFCIQQEEPEEMAFEFSFQVTSPQPGELTAQLDGVLDMGFMELPLYISATGPDDENFGNVLFQALLEDFMGWMLLAFFSPSFFLLDVPEVTVETDDTGEWMDVPVEAQLVYLEDGAILERSFQLVDEDGVFLEEVLLTFVVEETQVKTYNLQADEMVTFPGYLVKSDLGSYLGEGEKIYAEMTLVPEFPLPTRIFFHQEGEDPQLGSFTTKASIRISEFILP